MTGGPDLSLLEVSEASTIIQEAAHEDANIIFGAVIDPTLHGRVKITVIATGFDRPARPAASLGTTTPVDLAHYNAKPRTDTPAGLPLAGRTIARRPAIDLPPPMAMAAGSEGQVIEGLDGPSPLDVPAFLRRQSE